MLNKLTIDDFATKVALDKIYANGYAAIAGHFMILLIVSFIFYHQVSWNVSLFIFFLHITILFLRLLSLIKYQKIQDTLEDKTGIRYWLRIYKIGTFMSGAAWGSIFFFLSGVPIEYQLILFAVVIGLSSSALLTIGRIISVYMAFILPMLLTTIVWFLLQDGLTYFVAAVLAIIGLLYHFKTSKEYANSFKEVTIEKEKSKTYVKALEKEYETFETLFEKSPDGGLMIKNNTIIQCNEKILKILGYSSKEELLNIDPHMLFPQFQSNGLRSDEEFELMVKKAIQNKSHNFEWKFIKSNKSMIWIDVTLMHIDIQEKNVLYMICRDISSKKEAEKQLMRQKEILDYQAHHDFVTKLPNRVLFDKRLHKGINRARINGVNLALLFVDLDNFKQINDSFGHDVGDKFLRMVTHRLKSNIRKFDTLARFGGDEFAIIMEDVSKNEDSAILAQTILNTLIEPFYIDGNVLYISGSIGISLYPKDGEEPEALLKYADTAMYKAKDEGRNNFQFYASDMTQNTHERVKLSTSLRQAILNEEFIVYYQPQIDASTEKIVSLEALVRWEHPTMGLVSPAKFIPLAEETGVIIDIDYMVMQMAMNQLSKWRSEGLDPGVLSLNLTMGQLERSDFIKILNYQMKRFRFKPEWLEFEITEGQVMKKPEEAIIKLKELSELGVSIAIDDFGTGYSSLSYLKRFPLNKLKIDRAFVQYIPDNEEDVSIVRAIVALAESLNLTILAEGVETKEQKDFLLANGCSKMQGYFYGKPMTSEEMKFFLLENTDKNDDA